MPAPGLAMHGACDRCAADLPADAPGAFICSFETTFCAACAEDLDERCPTCGGELLDRPVRTRRAAAAQAAAAG